jgi:iron complex outermembrane receptor protein
MRFRNNSDLVIRPGLLLGVSMAALIAGSPAMAQTPPEETAPPAEVPVAPQPVDPAAEPAEEGTIVVTGSRIRTVNEFNSPDPITVIDPNLSAREGKFDTASTLQSSPIAAGSTQITAAISSNFVTNGGPGAQTIDLRGLGANRTLVLLNGRRAGPAGTRGGVSSFDLNVLPQSIAENIQILKTGASSVYGSDAVAGVVNIITKTETDGIELDMSASAPFDSGGEQYRISGIWGKKFDRGHVLVAADYFKQNELARGHRRYLDCPEAYVFDPETGDRADLVDPRTGNFKCEDLRWGHVWTYNLIDNLFLDGPGGPDTGPNTSILGGTVLMQFQYPGETLGIPAFGAPSFAGDFGAPPGWFPTGYDVPSLAVQNSIHPYVLEQTLIPKTERMTIYADASYEITDNIEVFGEFLANRRKTYQNGWRQIWNFGGTEDLYDTLWAEGWNGINLLSPTAITNHSDSSQKVDYYRAVGGLRGDFGSFLPGWGFDSHVQYSHNKGRYRSEQFLQDVYDSGYFQTASCVGTTLPVSGKQCIDLPWNDPFFLRGEVTPEQADFMFDWEEGVTIYKQLVGEFSVSGPLFELPGGTTSLALGVAVRRDEIEDTPGEITRAGNAWGTTTAGITAGHSLTKEAFGEISVPLLKDRSFFKDLTVSGAARITNVEATRKSDGFSDSSKGNWTYKLGANWAVNEWLRFRGTYGTSYRAPALFEQFLADETSFPSQRAIDPCVNIASNLAQGNITQRQFDNCFADLVDLPGTPGDDRLTHPGGGVTATAIAQGGIGVLEPETSKAWTASVILTPRLDFLPDTRISLAIDYFNIKVEGEIDQLGARNILFECYDSPDFPTDPLCDLFTRGQTAAPNNVATVTDKFINIASQKNTGVDITANIRHDLGRLGTLNFLASATRQLKDDLLLLPGSPLETDNGEVGSPKWVADFNLTWQPRGGWTIFYGIDMIGKTSNKEEVLEAQNDLCSIQGPAQDPETETIRPSYCLDVTTPMKWYHSASISKEIGDKFEMTLGITNIFDTRPPRVSVLNTGASNISLIGPVVAASQYDFLGRRLFVHVKRKF